MTLRGTAWFSWVLTSFAFGAPVSIDIPPVPVSVSISGQTISIPVSGRISEAADPTQPNGVKSLNFNLHADLTDLQGHSTVILREQLNREERCGDRISVDRATLMPSANSARLTIEMQFEKWVCIKALGKENAKRLVGGSGVVTLLLTPTVEANAVRLNAEVADVEAAGQLGNLLQSGAGSAIREKIRDAMLKAVRKSAAFDVVLPAAAQPYASLGSVSFMDAGGGQLFLSTSGRLALPMDRAAALLDAFVYRH